MLADRLDMPFVDSDKIIEATYGVRLEDITRAFGREQFLDAECKIIQAINLPGCVIATGGSVIYREPAMAWLKHLGAVIYLTVPLAVVEERVARNPERGIAFGPGQTLTDLYNERCGLYTKYADFECDTASIPPAESANQIADFFVAKKAGI